MKILLVNDDGYKAKGITLLAERLAKENEVFMVAPNVCQSGMGHAMTFRKPISVRKIKDYTWECYAISGTPADCALIGIDLMKATGLPDILISGINDCCNLGTEIIYSGTVNAAVEASIYGIPAIAVSANVKREYFDADFEYITDFFIKNFPFYLSISNPDVPLSININNERRGNRGHKFAEIGERKYDEQYAITEKEDGSFIYLLDGLPIKPQFDESSDVYWFKQGYATITPLRCEYAHFEKLKELKKRFDGESL